jgi:hypothetical protein
MHHRRITYNGKQVTGKSQAMRRQVMRKVFVSIDDGI